MCYMINLIMPIDRSYITFYASNNNNSTNRSDGFNASSLSSIKSIFHFSNYYSLYKNTLGANLM